MLRMRATRERAELVVEQRVIPGVLRLLRCLLTVGRRRGVEDGAEDEEKVGEDKPTPAVRVLHDAA